MYNSFLEIFKGLIKQEDLFLSVAAMCVRGFILYLFALFFIRFNRKFIVIRTPFNFILYVMLGSITATAITVEALFFPILITITFLSFINKGMAALGFYFPSFDNFFKGSPIVIIRNGEIRWDAMKKNYITKEELINELRSQLHIDNVSDIALATITSNKIYFIKK